MSQVPCSVLVNLAFFTMSWCRRPVMFTRNGARLLGFRISDIGTLVALYPPFVHERKTSLGLCQPSFSTDQLLTALGRKTVPSRGKGQVKYLLVPSVPLFPPTVSLSCPLALQPSTPPTLPLTRKQSHCLPTHTRTETAVSTNSVGYRVALPLVASGEPGVAANGLSCRHDRDNPG
jgi:hypothetical protein